MCTHKILGILHHATCTALPSLVFTPASHVRLGHALACSPLTPAACCCRNQFIPEKDTSIPHGWLDFMSLNVIILTKRWILCCLTILPPAQPTEVISCCCVFHRPQQPKHSLSSIHPWLLVPKRSFAAAAWNNSIPHQVTSPLWDFKTVAVS